MDDLGLGGTVAVVVNLTLLQAAVLARAAVVVTSALDCKDANAAEQGLLLFRQAVFRAVSNDTARNRRPTAELYAAGYLLRRVSDGGKPGRALMQHHMHTRYSAA